MGPLRRVLLALTTLGVLSCSTRATGRVIYPSDGRRTPDASAPIRVAIVSASPVISATSDFAWYQPDGNSLLARGQSGETWRLERHSQNGQVRALNPSGVATAWSRSVVARAAAGGFLTVGGRRYRGELLVTSHADSLVVVNRVPLEEYLLSVVAMEMGNRPMTDWAANEAQAVAARSYAVRRMSNEDRPFDVYSTVSDQAYGGVDVENPGATAAVNTTRGLVLLYRGQVADAVYSSTCGGSTAEITEVWYRRSPVPYLQRVSDRIPNSERFYCDIAPRYRWTTTLTASQLDATLARYMAAYAKVPAGGPGKARTLEVRERTPSGRVHTLDIRTEQGTFAIRANDIRFVVRSPGGEILNSTYFSVHPEYGTGNALRQVTFRGQGYGHGVGMCQWGAIGRSRAGQTFRTILATYYPGTTVGPVQ